MKKIEIIPIAEKKIRQRGIERSLVIETATHPPQIAEGYGGRKVAQRKLQIDGKEYLLRVVYEDTDDVTIVITAYLTSQIDRYWKEGGRIV